MATTLHTRLTKLEALQPNNDPEGCVYSLIAREGHEEEDTAAYFASEGITPTEHDLTITRVIVLVPGQPKGECRYPSVDASDAA